MLCKLCKKESASASLGVCKDCIINKWDKAKIFARQAHAISRKRFGLPTEIPRKGKLCGLCANNCKIPDGGFGYCGLTKNENGKIIRLAGTPENGLLEYYYDVHPTNCVGSWCCGACGYGYPKYSLKPKPQGESGFLNLSVFYGACCFNCLFCQNWHFKYMTQRLEPLVSAKQLVSAINERTTCVCFFGGDPAPQLPHAIATARIAKEKFPNRILRWCLETNGLENQKLLKEFAKIAFDSGGNIKFDLKFFSEKLSLALSGVSNKQSYKNFEMLAEFNAERKEPPFLIASTLLIPWYVDSEEIFSIAKFIASIDENIPYSLLAFYPCFEMNDLPTTSWKQAKECNEAAKKAGIKRVRIGNVHLLR